MFQNQDDMPETLVHVINMAIMATESCVDQMTPTHNLVETEAIEQEDGTFRLQVSLFSLAEFIKHRQSDGTEKSVLRVFRHLKKLMRDNHANGAVSVNVKIEGGYDEYVVRLPDFGVSVFDESGNLVWLVCSEIAVSLMAVLEEKDENNEVLH